MCGKIQILILHGVKANKISGFLNLLTLRHPVHDDDNKTGSSSVSLQLAAFHIQDIKLAYNCFHPTFSKQQNSFYLKDTFPHLELHL